MNEPSSFVDGSVDSCPDSDLEIPPYTPSQCMVARVVVQTLHLGFDKNIDSAVVKLTVLWTG